MSSWKRVALWLSLWMTKGAESFVVVVGPSSTMTTTTLLMVQRHEYLQPHFEAPPSPKESTLRMDRVIECAQGEGACSLEEMESMMKGKKCHDVTMMRRTSDVTLGVSHLTLAIFDP